MIEERGGAIGPRLAPPGAGVPIWQRLAGRYLLLPGYCARLTWDGVPDLMDQQGHDLVALANDRVDRSLCRPVLIPPQIGLEDSSRNYSYAMVLEHLTIIGHAITRIVVDLSRSMRPPGVVRTADLKPHGKQSAADARRAYRDMLADFRRRTLEEAGDRDSRVRYAHPWFGPLTAFQWICFAPFHQTIHLRQARRIVSRLPDDHRD
jgi:hypothetical protein